MFYQNYIIKVKKAEQELKSGETIEPSDSRRDGDAICNTRHYGREDKNPNTITNFRKHGEQLS